MARNMTTDDEPIHTSTRVPLAEGVDRHTRSAVETETAQEEVRIVTGRIAPR